MYYTKGFFSILIILLSGIFVATVADFIFAGVTEVSVFSSPSELKVVDIIFYHDFLSDQVELADNDNDCFKLPDNHSITRCKEYAHLLRPVAVTEKWQEQQRRQGYFLLTDTEAGIREVHAHLIRMHDSAVKAVHATHQAGRVTGRIIRYSPAVKTYTFYDLNTHIRSKINATPEHRFYVVNKRAFIPLSKITSEDQLVNESGKSVKLLYAVKNGGNNNKHLLPVHNLEVADHHVYFAGTGRILVHNGCFDEELFSGYLADKSIEEAAWFVNSQVNRYVRYSLSRMAVNRKYFNNGPTNMLFGSEEEDILSAEQMLNFMLILREESGSQVSQQLREEVAIELAIKFECGNAAEMCLVGKKVLEVYGFRESVQMVCAESNAFLVLGDEEVNKWIADPWGKISFPISKIDEKLRLYKAEFDPMNVQNELGVNGKLLSRSDYEQQYNGGKAIELFEGIY